MKVIRCARRFSLASSLAVLAIAALSQVQPASAANLVSNGGFEQDLGLKNGGWGTYDAIQGWQATPGGKIEVQRGAAGSAYEGSQLVELDSHNYTVTPNQALGLFQDIATQIGQTYTLSFAYSARPGTSAANNDFSVLFGNGWSQSIKGAAGGQQTLWSILTTTVVATSDVTRLQFNYDGARDTLGAYIDDVRLEAMVGSDQSAGAPEPTTMAGLAIAGLGLAARKKLKACRVSTNMPS